MLQERISGTINFEHMALILAFDLLYKNIDIASVRQFLTLSVFYLYLSKNDKTVFAYYHDYSVT